MQFAIQHCLNSNTVLPLYSRRVLLDSQEQEGSRAATPEAAAVASGSAPLSPAASRHSTAGAGSGSPGGMLASKSRSSLSGFQRGASDGASLVSAPSAASAAVGGPAAAEKERKRAGVRALLAEVATLRQERQVLVSELEELKCFNARLAQENCR